jgi:hypothetical protein
MKLWLDDALSPPDDTWSWVRTVEDAISLLEGGAVQEASLDNDLAGERASRTGREVCHWMAEHGVWPTLALTIHTQNKQALAEMCELVREKGPYRHDLGRTFIRHDLDMMRKLGWRPPL